MTRIVTLNAEEDEPTRLGTNRVEVATATIYQELKRGKTVGEDGASLLELNRWQISRLSCSMTLLRTDSPEGIVCRSIVVDSTTDGFIGWIFPLLLLQHIAPG